MTLITILKILTCLVFTEVSIAFAIVSFGSIIDFIASRVSLPLSYIPSKISVKPIPVILVLFTLVFLNIKLWAAGLG